MSFEYSRTSDQAFPSFQLSSPSVPSAPLKETGSLATQNGLAVMSQGLRSPLVAARDLNDWHSVSPMRALNRHPQDPRPETRTIPIEAPTISERSPPVVRALGPQYILASSSPRKGEKGYIPRPRNAFMIFRSNFNMKNDAKPDEDKIRSQASLSRSAGKYWNELDSETKAYYKAEAVKEAHRHLLRYPGYHYSPAARRRKTAVQGKKN